MPGTNFKKDYLNLAGIYDKGHMANAANNTWTKQGMAASFHFTNVTPQTPQLNRGPWRSVEDFERTSALNGNDIFVLCGNIGFQEDYYWGYKTIGPDNIIVPAYCWKIVIVRAVTGLADTIAYLFPDQKTTTGQPKKYKVNYKEIEKEVGLSVRDMMSLNEIKDSQARVNYMAERLKSKSENLSAIEKMEKNEILSRIKNHYPDPNDFLKTCRAQGIEIPEDATIDSFITKTLSDSKSQLNTASASFMSDLESNKNNSQFVLNKYIGGVGEIFAKARLCACCGLPLSFPVCLCKLPSSL